MKLEKIKKVFKKCNILKKFWILMGERNKKVSKKCPLFKIFRVLIDEKTKKLKKFRQMEKNNCPYIMKILKI